MDHSVNDSQCRRCFHAVCGVTLSLLLLTSCATEDHLVVDTIYFGEHILTMDNNFADATAVAIQGEKIVWVGRRDEWQGEAANVVELGDRALLPGLIDAHGHLVFLARTINLANVASPPVGAVSTIASLQETMRAYIRDRDIPPGEWVVGMGYDDSLIRERRHPDRDDLDAVSTNHPVALIHVSGHLMTANSLALKEAGITADTPNPPGGVIRRRIDGLEPNGVLEETATAPLRDFYLGDGGITAEDIDKALLTYASHGVTTVQDGAASWQIYDLLTTVSEEKGLRLDVVIYPQGMDEAFTIPEGVMLGKYRNRLKVGGIKLVLDGSPQGKTAYLSQPYKVVPDGLPEDYRGYPTISQEAVNRKVSRFINERVPMLVHCNGDAAAEMLIDALELTAERTPLGDHRTVMIHAQTVREDQLDRMQVLGVVPSFFSAHTFYWGDWHRDSVLGKERAFRISPTRSALKRGMPFTVHNDAPIVPPDMIRLLWATTNRLTRSGQILGEAQRLSTLEAIRAVTVNAAYQNFEEDIKGSITPGKQADLIIFSENPLDMAREDLLGLSIVETISRGISVYFNDEPKS